MAADANQSSNGRDICVMHVIITVQSKSLLHLYIRRGISLYHSRRNGEIYNVKRVK